MKQTAVEWLVEQILTEVQDYEDSDIETESEPFKHEYVNKYIGMVDLSEFVNKAKAMEKQEKIEFACQVAEASAEKYIQGKTTWQIAEELLTFKSE